MKEKQAKRYQRTEKIYRNNSLSYCEDKFLSTEDILMHVFFVIDSYCVIWVKIRSIQETKKTKRASDIRSPFFYNKH